MYVNIGVVSLLLEYFLGKGESILLKVGILEVPYKVSLHTKFHQPSNCHRSGERVF